MMKVLVGFNSGGMPKRFLASNTHFITFAEIVGQENGYRRHRLPPRWPRPSPDRVCQATRPVRRRGDCEQEVVEFNSKVPLRDERNKKQASLEIKV